jgi:hypothetical protein
MLKLIALTLLILLLLLEFAGVALMTWAAWKKDTDAYILPCIVLGGSMGLTIAMIQDTWALLRQSKGT